MYRLCSIVLPSHLHVLLSYYVQIVQHCASFSSSCPLVLLCTDCAALCFPLIFMSSCPVMYRLCSIVLPSHLYALVSCYVQIVQHCASLSSLCPLVLLCADCAALYFPLIFMSSCPDVIIMDIISDLLRV